MKGISNGLFTGILLGLIAGLILATTTFALAEQPIKLIVNGKEIQSDVPPQVINGRTMVPVRFIVEAMGAKVEWDEANNAVIVTSQIQNNEKPTDLTPVSPNLSPIQTENNGMSNNNSAPFYTKPIIIRTPAVDTQQKAKYIELRKIERQSMEDEHNRRIRDWQEQINYHSVRTGIEHTRAITEYQKKIADENQRWELVKKRWEIEDR